MHLSLVDWTIVLLSVVTLRFISLATKRYMKGVADFLSANRSAGRYLLTIAGQMGGTGVISFVAVFEVYYGAGFPPIWWGLMSIPVGAVIILTGWVYYRFRETRALTLAQFFEMRYSKNFRVFAGFLCWATGLLNFGIFPAVAARFLIYFCGLPDHFCIPGLPFQFSTFATVMAVDLALALTFVTMGGQVSVMITECAQGIFATIVFVIINASLILKFSWTRIVDALATTAPANASMLHPFHTSNVTDFNVWYYLIGIFGAVYGYMTWQGNSGFNCAARTPHEQKMGAIISIWRVIPQSLMGLVLSVIAYAVLHLPEFSSSAALINNSINHIDNPAIQGQMRVPLAMAYILPIGIKGLLATVMIFASFTCHDTYMHSWGSIFIQDVYMPLKRRALEPHEHIRLLRWSIIGVAIFSFFFSLLYPPNGKILMFFAITGTIWVAGSGAAIIGGLYWKRGTTAAAYTALIFGAIVGVAGLIYPPVFESHYHRTFPVNNQYLYFFAMCGAGIIYVIVSLLTGRRGKEFNLDRMLHHGIYANPSDAAEEESLPSRWQRFVGITKEFSRSDKALAIGLVIWNAVWFGLFLVISAWNLVFHVSTTWWAGFWHVYIWLYFLIGIPIAVWFTVGGILDMRALLKTLSSPVRDHADDGRVVHVYDPESDGV